MSPELSPEALRLLDANLNRAREALRMAEDYVRFALDDADLSRLLKTLRHDLSSATADVAGKALLHRDTPADVGTGIVGPKERQRQDLSAAVVAAGKRFGEAIRVVEELLKISDGEAAAIVEQVRYRFYEVERRIALTLRPAKGMARVRVCVLITESACRVDWFSTAEQALAGGAGAIQLREPELPAGELLERARRLGALCRDAGALLIVNDRPDVAVLARADGVHLGQTDLPAAAVRRLVGPRMILGVSTHTIEQVRQARLDGADYVGVGPVFPSTTKPRDILPGIPFARAAVDLGLLPAFAIAGITPDNVNQVWATGIHGVAVTRSVTMAPDPAAAVRALLPPA